MVAKAGNRKLFDRILWSGFDIVDWAFYTILFDSKLQTPARIAIVTATVIVNWAITTAPEKFFNKQRSNVPDNCPDPRYRLGFGLRWSSCVCI